jgi:protein-S-isoprenylcysteine O-methyltransferase Ste14
MWMGLWPQAAIYIPWYIWAASWVAAAFWANRTLNRAGSAREWPYRVLEFGGFFMLLFYFVDNGQPAPTGNPILDLLMHRYWLLPLDVNWAMVGLATLGFLFCWWARLHLGRLWSGWITKKEGHRIIDTGPYAIVRHPIYTGVLTAALATMAVKGTGHAMLGVALLIAGYWLKARLEERFLREELGAEAYDSYRRRVPMLVPFGPKSG